MANRDRAWDALIVAAVPETMEAPERSRNDEFDAL
jgi:hypothetical protein